MFALSIIGILFLHTLLRGRSTHAGATPDPKTGAGKLSLDALDDAVQDDHPRYDSDQVTTSS